MAALLEKTTNQVEQVKPFRSEVWLADLRHAEGSEQGGVRPVLVIQNDIGNKYAPTTIVVPISSKMSKNNIPTHVQLDIEKTGLERISIALCEQIKCIDKSKLKHRITKLDPSIMNLIDRSIQISVGLSILN